MNYKSYQQVLDLSGGKKCTLKARPVQSRDATEPKRRTKSGCLTCRRRKKKCDEEVEGGKCQACIRNFLDCCWAGNESNQQATDLKIEASKVEAITESPLMKFNTTKAFSPRKGASAYPSPISSPKATPADDLKSIHSISLPPINMKVEKPRKKKVIDLHHSKAAFVVTSFDKRNALCQIK